MRINWFIKYIFRTFLFVFSIMGWFLLALLMHWFQIKENYIYLDVSWIENFGFYVLIVDIIFMIICVVSISFIISDLMKEK